jgi:hypothetical protein
MSQLSRGKAHRARNLKSIKCRALAIAILDRMPPVKRLVRRIWYDITLLRYKYEWGKLKKEYGTELEIDKVYWVEPEKIEYASLIEFDIHKDQGRAIEGNWDSLEKRYGDLDINVAFKQRFIDGKRWQDTLFYQRRLDRIANGDFSWGRNQSDLDKRCESWETLYQNIQQQGYKTQRELLREKNLTHSLLVEDEITINIGRSGDLLFNNGAHRLSIAKLIGLEKIPVKITVRHPQWMGFRRQILSYAQENNGRIYSPISHIDLQDIPAVHDSESDRFNMIKENLSVRSGRLLDIGANWGYFCHRFEQLGLDCYAVEYNGVNLFFLKKLKRAENRLFKIIPKSIFECEEVTKVSFDVVLALNIFHHFLKDEASYLKLVNLLKNLKAGAMYFEPHCPGETQMENVYKNYSEEEFVEFILKSSKFSQAKLIGRAKDNRGIYKLY